MIFSLQVKEDMNILDRTRLHNLTKATKEMVHYNRSIITALKIDEGYILWEYERMLMLNLILFISENDGTNQT